MADSKHIVHVFFAFRVGGSEVRTCRIINGLGPDYRHTIVSLTDNFEAARLLDGSSRVELLYARGFAGSTYPRNVLAARGWLRRLNPDLVVCYAWGGFEWIVANAPRKVCPDVFSAEGFIEDEVDRQKPKRWILRRLFAPRCTRVHACSLRLQRLASASWRVSPRRIAYIPNGVDLSVFRPPDECVARKPLQLGIVASLSPVKNHLLLLHAFRRLPAGVAKLRIIGDGPERNAIEQAIAEYGLEHHVTLLGHQGSPDQLLRELDVFCLSSTSEQMPMVILEAMAAGLPVVSTRVGDVEDMVCEQNRPFIVPTGDPQAYADALLELLSDAGKRVELGRQNRRRCEDEFGLPLMLARHRQLYDSCMARSS